MTTAARLVDPRDPALLAAWRELASRAEEPNPFFEPELLLPAVELLPGGSAVRLLVVSDGDRLLLAAPVHGDRAARVPGRVLTTWQHPYCYAGSPLQAPGSGPSAWAAALAALGAAGHSALHLPRLPLDGPVATALRGAGAPLRVLREEQRPAVLRRDASTYLDATLGSRSRRRLVRQRRRLAEELGVPPSLVDGAPLDAAGAVGRFLALESAGWKGRARTAMACTPTGRAYAERVTVALAAAGRLQAWELGAPGRPAAAQLNVLAGDVVFHWKTAYDERWSACSPGLQLEVAMVEEFHRDRRLRLIDPCTDPGPTLSERLYPDRVRLGAALVPLSVSARAVAALGPTTLAVARAARSRLRGTR